MFVARESGPELVGRIGNSSAVANNNQIIEGIKQGVLEAMTLANATYSNNSNQTIKLYNVLEERVLGETTLKYQNGKYVRTNGR